VRGTVDARGVPQKSDQMLAIWKVVGHMILPAGILASRRCLFFGKNANIHKGIHRCSLVSCNCGLGNLRWLMRLDLVCEKNVLVILVRIVGNREMTRKHFSAKFQCANQRDY